MRKYAVFWASFGLVASVAVLGAPPALTQVRFRERLSSHQSDHSYAHQERIRRLWENENPSHRSAGRFSSDPRAGKFSYRWAPTTDPLADADALGIPRSRFEVASGSGLVFYKTSTASYPVNPTEMREMQEAVSAGLASGDGFLVQRLESPDREASPAFLLYTGPGAPQEFVGDDSLERLAAMASAANSNLTIVGSGTAIDFDAAKLTIAMQLQLEAVPAANKSTMFRTPPRFERFSEPGTRSLSLEDTHIAFRDGHWETTQKVGAAIIRVIAATKELALQALASIRIALFVNLNAIYITEDDPPRIDHAHLNALAPEDQSNIIDAAVTSARAAYQSLHGDQLGLPSGDVDIHVEIGNQKKSVRFADAFLPPAIELAATD
jgi:hypothetical protein